MNSQNGFNLITSQDDPSDSQLSELMSHVRQVARSRVARVDSQLNESLSKAISAKKDQQIRRS